MKIIYRAENILEAHIVCGMLNAEGIEAEVAGGEASSQLAWWLLIAALIVLFASWGLLS